MIPVQAGVAASPTQASKVSRNCAASTGSIRAASMRRRARTLSSTVWWVASWNTWVRVSGELCAAGKPPPGKF